MASTLIYTEPMASYSSMQVNLQPPTFLSGDTTSCASAPDVRFLHLSSSFSGHCMQLPWSFLAHVYLTLFPDDNLSRGALLAHI